MSEILPASSMFGAFVAARLLLAITPGPGVFYIVTRSVTQGRACGLASVAGVALGNLANALGAAVGLAALFAVSSVAFTVIKYLGAGYLVYLGIRAMRRSAAPAGIDSAPLPRTALRRIFRDGFVVALLNPKTALFFAAFLPQFIDQGHSSLVQTCALGGVFVMIAAVTDSAYAVAAGAARPWLRRAGRFPACGRYLTGGTFVGLGLFTAFSGQRLPQ